MSRCLSLSLQALMFFTTPLAFAQTFSGDPVRIPPPVDVPRMPAPVVGGKPYAPPPVVTPSPAPAVSQPQAWNAQRPPVVTNTAPPASVPWSAPPNAAAPRFAPPNTATQALHNANLQRPNVALVARQEAVPPAPMPAGPPPVPPPDSLPAPVQIGMTPMPQRTIFNLDQLTAIAEQQNPILERSEAEIEAAMGERVQAALYPNPRFETNNPEIWAGKQSFYNFGFQQDLVTKGKIRLDKAAADQLVRSESAGYNVDRAQMLTEVRSQYIQCLAGKQRVLLAQYLNKVSGQSLDVAKQLFRAGEGSQTDVLLLDSEYQRSLADLDNARTLLDGELKQLAAVTGVPDLVITDVEGTLFHIAPEFNEVALRSFVSNNSALMERMQAEIIRSQVLLRRAEVEAYPNMRFGPAFQSGTTSGQGQFWLSVVFDIPVWDLNQGNIRKAQAKVRGAHADLEVVRNELLKQTAEKFARYRAAKQVAERIQNSILPNSQKALSLVQDGFSKGQFDVNRVLQAQRVLSDVAREHIEASEKAWTGAAELGGLIQLEYFPIGRPQQPQR